MVGLGLAGVMKGNIVQGRCSPGKERECSGRAEKYDAEGAMPVCAKKRLRFEGREKGATDGSLVLLLHG